MHVSRKNSQSRLFVNRSETTDGGRLTINADASKKELTMAVNILETDFGVVNVLPEIFISPKDVSTVLYDSLVIYEAAKIACKTFRPMERQELAKTGDSRKFYITTSKTILPDSRKCVGKIINLTRVKVS